MDLLAIDSLIAGSRIGEVLGTGGLGTVYRATLGLPRRDAVTVARESTSHGCGPRHDTNKLSGRGALPGDRATCVLRPRYGGEAGDPEAARRTT